MPASVYITVTAQPGVLGHGRTSRRTTYHTLEEKRAWADRVASGETGFLPLCMEHAGAEKEDAAPGGRFVVPGPLQIGRIVWAGVRGNGDLIVAGELFFERPEARQLLAAIRRGERWGVSLCTDLRLEQDTSEVTFKNISHLGITRTPEFGAEGTWIHRIYESSDTLDRDFKANVLNRDPHFYLPALARERLEERLSISAGHLPGKERPRGPAVLLILL